MATVESYEIDARREGIGGGRVTAAIGLAAMVHLGLYLLASHYTFRAFGDPYYEQLVPTRFSVKRVEIDPKLLAESPAEQAPPRTIAEIIELKAPQERVTQEQLPKELRAAPLESKVKEEIVSESPSLPQPDLRSAMAKIEQNARRAMESDLRSLHDELLAKRTDPPRGPSMPLPKLPPDSGDGTGGIGHGADPLIAANYSDLDALLRQSGPVQPGTAPILIPTDLLFDYDKSSLRDAARQSLTKLAAILSRNPDASFTIEGHTDSFGTDRYNLELSRRRAQAVKSWLVDQAQITPARIEVVGLGESKLLKPASGTVEEQQLNRRVEIVIRTSR